MSIQPDSWIKEMAIDHGMISPFVETKVHEIPAGYTQESPSLARSESGTLMRFDPDDRKKVISFGVSSFGYDLRVADTFKVFTPVDCAIVDPKKIDERCFVERKGPHVLIPPNSFALAYSVEKFKIPNDVMCVVVGKSTYARCGIICNVTPLEPGWEGHVTLEISNTTPLPAKVYSGEGLCQVLFYKADTPCEMPYGSAGKYQAQAAEVTLPR